jgi:hypothetical protein
MAHSAGYGNPFKYFGRCHVHPILSTMDIEEAEHCLWPFALNIHLSQVIDTTKSTNRSQSQ